MKISHRLYLVSITGALAGAAVAVWIAITALGSAEQTRSSVDHAFEAMRYAVEFRNTKLQAKENLERLVSMETVENFDAMLAEHQRMTAVASLVAEEIGQHAFSDDLKSAATDLIGKWQVWKADADILFGLEVSGSIPTAEAMRRHDAALDALMADVLRLANIAATQASERISETLWASLSLAGGIGAMVLIGAGLIAIRTIGAVTAGLRSIGWDMERLAKGETEIDESLADRGDEIGAMARSVAYFRQALVERAALEERNADEAERQKRLADQQSLLIDRLEKIVAAGVAGDFSASMDANGLEGPQLQLAGSVNTLLDAVGSGLAAISLVMSDLAEADLTSRMEGDFRGSFASLRDNVNKTCETLATLIHKVQDMVDNIDRGTETLSRNGTELTACSKDQSESINATNHTVAAMVERVAQSRELSAGAARRVGEAEETADNGQTVVAQSVDAIREIEKSSQKITDIISVIESIAFQTNLLALNAAVEAARAGESGKGFAVVATEVRTLAQRTTEAARDISGLIRDSSAKVDQGVVLAEAAGTALEDIKTAIVAVARDVRTISEQSAQLSADAGEVRAAMHELQDLSERSGAIVADSSETAMDFETMTRELSAAVARFRVSGISAIRVETDPVAVETGAGQVHVPARLVQAGR